MRLIWYVGDGNGDALITDEHRRQAVKDFREYKVTTLVLPVTHPRADLVKNTVDALVGPARLVEDCWVWDIRQFVANGVPS
jgi:hypothetical protein